MSINSRTKRKNKTLLWLPLAPLLKSGFLDGFILSYFLSVFLLAGNAGWDEPAEFGNKLIFFATMWFVTSMGSIVMVALRIPSLGFFVFAPPSHRSQIEEPYSWYQNFRVWQVLAVFILTVVVGIQVVGVSWYKIADNDAFSAVARLFNALLHPDTMILPKAIFKIIETIYIAFIATFLAAPIAFCLSFLAARNVIATNRRGYTVFVLMRASFNILRAVEPILWAIIFSVWVGFGAFAGSLALMIHSVASLAKQYSEIVETVSDGPIEGVLSTGANRLQTIWFAIVPQVYLPFISYTIDRWDINVRMATIIGFVGGGGIGVMLLEYQGQARWNQVGCIIFVIAFVVWTMDSLSSAVRNALK